MGEGAEAGGRRTLGGDSPNPSSIVGRFVDTANGGQSGSLKTPIAMRVSAFQFDGHDDPPQGVADGPARLDFRRRKNVALLDSPAFEAPSALPGEGAGFNIEGEVASLSRCEPRAAAGAR